VARKARIPHPGAVCHDLNRGGRREAVLAGDQDRRRFLETLEHRGKGEPRKGATGLGLASLSKKHDDTTRPPCLYGSQRCQKAGETRMNQIYISLVSSDPFANKWGWIARNPGAKIIPEAVIVNPGYPIWLGLNQPLHWTNNPSR